VRAGESGAVTGPAHLPRKRFGQHFLTDRAAVDRIVAAIAPAPGDRLVEIGPGQGALTAPLLERVNRMDAVEIDRDLAAALAQRFPGERLCLHAADALAFDFCALGTALRVVGNLPYNISSPLLFHLAQQSACLRDCHFMLQLEVVERMAARPGGRTFGRLSVMLQYRFAVEQLFRVPAGAFRPAPKVESAVVRLVPQPAGAPRARDEGRFASLVAGAFSQRRKTLRNALRPWLSEAQIAQAGIDPGARAETLAVADFVRLADLIPVRAAG
jgi:16S rRNA (adenine1518-N6/adenine1519-N6)-dimethyltransferase